MPPIANVSEIAVVSYLVILVQLKRILIPFLSSNVLPSDSTGVVYVNFPAIASISITSVDVPLISQIGRLSASQK